MRLVVLSIVFAAAAACTNSAPPTPTEATCPDVNSMALTWDAFGQKFMADYCTDCHASTLTHAARNGAPLYHDYDTLMGVLEIPDHIDQYSGSGPGATNTLMPPSRCPSTPGGSLDRDCPKPTEDQRAMLSMWLACEKARPH